MDARIPCANRQTPAWIGRCAALLVFGAVAFASPRLMATEDIYAQQVQPFLKAHCQECHSGAEAEEGLDLTMAVPAQMKSASGQQIEALRNIAQRLRARTMPPEDFEPRPTPEQSDAVADWIDAQLHAALAGQSNPGDITIRRLTRIDYRNTIRDLFDVQIDTSDFPSDDVAHGFDNLADVISLPPLLMDRYVQAAQQVVDQLGPDYFKKQLIAGKPPREAARQVLAPLVERAFRRPVEPHEVDRYTDLVAQAVTAEQSVEDGLALAVQALLLSPHFLYRIEEEAPLGADHPINDFELATRLSYFLWSSMPDEQLFQLAHQNKLRAQLQLQIERMLKDDKIEQGLVENFAGQWLQTRRLETIAPDPKLFPKFDESLRAAMGRETQLLFAHVVRQDRSVLELLNAEYTFVNQRLAEHYGLPGVEGEQFRRVSLKDSPRRGLLTQASILAINSHPTRSSPVKRGKWVMEAILGTSPPPPPADVPALEEVKLSGTLRERLEQHRSDPRCANCHRVMDPLGLALEHFDSTGRWREKDEGLPIDASGDLPDGARFDGAVELAAVLADDRADEFRRNLAKQLMIYALGRTLDFYDEPVIDHIASQAEAQDGRLSSFIVGVVESEAFQKLRNPAELRITKLPPGSDYEFSGNARQQAMLTVVPYEPGVAGKSPAELAPVELASIEPLLRTLTPEGVAPAKLTALDALNQDQAYRYRLDLPVGKPVYLFFAEGIIAPFEFSNDFRMPIEAVPAANKGDFLVADSHFTWTSDLIGPRNPRPGTIYSFDYRVELLSGGSGQADAFIVASAANTSMFLNAGGQDVTEPETVVTQVGSRNLGMLDGWYNKIKLSLRCSENVIVRDVSPIRFVRPMLGVNSTEPIRFGKLKPGQASANSAPRKVFNAQQTILTDAKGESWQTILYGAARFKTPEPKKPYLMESEHIGVQVVGEAASNFELVKEGTDAGVKELNLIGADGEPGLAGGPQAENETFHVRFRGATKPGVYKAAARVVTQAGDLGTLSKGGEGEPLAGLYYVDIPVEAEVVP